MLTTQQISRSATIKVSGTINKAVFQSGVLTVSVVLLTFFDSDGVLQSEASGELSIENLIGDFDEAGFRNCHAKLKPFSFSNIAGIAEFLECELGLYDFNIQVVSGRLTQSATFKTTGKIKGIDAKALFGVSLL